MKSVIVGILLLIGVSSIVSSCNDDLNLVGEFVETPVVVGILDQSETAHFIKVTRTFIGDGSTSSLTIAQNPDSSYFNQVDITVKEILNDGSTGRTFNLHDTIIENKDVNGVFYAPEQKVYVFYTPEGDPLIDDARYTLAINIDNGRINVTGETRLVNGLGLANTLVGNNKPLRFTASGVALGLYQAQSISVQQVGNARKLNAKIRFDYREISLPSDTVNKSILWNLGDADLARTRQLFHAARAEQLRGRDDLSPNGIPVDALEQGFQGVETAGPEALVAFEPALRVPHRPRIQPAADGALAERRQGALSQRAERAARPHVRLVLRRGPLTRST